MNEAEHTWMGNRFHYLEEESKGGASETPKAILNRMAAEHNADITVCGFHGRKGPKEDPTVMGTAVQYMACNGTAPVLIVKNGKEREEKATKHFKFGVLVDGSKNSLKALKLMAKMHQAGD